MSTRMLSTHYLCGCIQQFAKVYRVYSSPFLTHKWQRNSKCHTWLVGGLEHVLFFHILGMSSSQLTFTPSFFRGVGSTTNQLVFLKGKSRSGSSFSSQFQSPTSPGMMSPKTIRLKRDWPQTPAGMMAIHGHESRFHCFTLVQGHQGRNENAEGLCWSYPFSSGAILIHHLLRLCGVIFKSYLRAIFTVFMKIWHLPIYESRLWGSPATITRCHDVDPSYSLSKCLFDRIRCSGTFTRTNTS